MNVLEFQQVASTIPQQPGIYKYFNKQGVLIYVGKAKNIRKRTSSYFSKTITSYKTHELVQHIHRIEFTIVDSEQDAFLLENALIKEFQPKYNINLKDDKSYPYIVIKKEPFPRIFLTRKKILDGSEYLGPFTSAGKVRELISFIRQYIPLRNCKLPLSKNNIEKGKFKVCLEYHLGNCNGPCQGYETEERYAESINQIKQLLKGNLTPVKKYYQQQMKGFAGSLQFEKAAILKKKIEHLEQYESKSVIVSKHLTNIDVFSIVKEDDTAFVNYLMVQNGTIVQTHTIVLHSKLEETEEEILSLAMLDLRKTFNSMALELIIPFEVTYPENDIILTIPKLGDKKKLLELSLKNVWYFKEELIKKKMLHLKENQGSNKLKVLKELQEYLSLGELPIHIECFDNSNFQGSFPVSAMVCFREGLPSKKDYRHFNVKTVEGINDFATMKEVVYRRYKRLIDEEKPLPDLVIIDGGKGQLSAAMESIETLQLNGKLTLVGLAKNEEELFFYGDKESIKLPWQSDSLNLIRQIRDEVHRFGITFHRNKRSKGALINELDQIEGIGEKTINQLLKQFKSVKKIASLSEEILSEAVGKVKAKTIIEYFKQKGGLDGNPTPF